MQDAVTVILYILNRILELGKGQGLTANSADSHEPQQSLVCQSSDDVPTATVNSTEAMNTDLPDTPGSGPVAMETEGQPAEVQAGDYLPEG